MLLAMAFALITAAIVQTVFQHGSAIWAFIRHGKSEPDDIHNKLMRNYPETPRWYAKQNTSVFRGKNDNVAANIIALPLGQWQVTLFPGHCIFCSGYRRHCSRSHSNKHMAESRADTRLQVEKVSFPIWGVVLAILLTMVYAIPGGYIGGRSGVYVSLDRALVPRVQESSCLGCARQLSINTIVQLVPGYLMKGSALRNMVSTTR